MRFLALMAGVVRTLILVSLDWLASVFGALSRRRLYAGYVAFVRVDAIGDFIVWIGSAERLRRCYGSVSAVLIANEVWARLARDMGMWDAVIPVDVKRFQKKLGYRFSIVSRVSAAGCAIAINPTHSRLFCVDDALIRATRAPVRIGSSGDLANMKSWYKRLSDRNYTRLISVPGPDESEVVRHIHFLRGLGIDCPEIELSDLKSYGTLIQNRYASAAPYFVLMPGAGWSGRRWPAERYAYIAGHLYEAHGLRGIVAGDGADAELAGRIVDSSAAILQNATGLTDMNGLIGLIRDARLVVCNDTSAVHIAAALGVPCVCVLGGGHPGRFAPYRAGWRAAGVLPVSVRKRMDCFGCNWQCIYDVPRESAVPCISGIGVEEVAAVIDDVLRGRLEPLDRDLAAQHV